MTCSANKDDCDVRLYERHGSKTRRKLVLDSVVSSLGDEKFGSRVYCGVGRVSLLKREGLSNLGKFEVFSRSLKILVMIFN